MFDKEGKLHVKIVPGAKQSMIGEITEDALGIKRLTIKVKAIAEDGKANKELIKFVAKTFNLKQKNISIISGQKSRMKTLRIISP